MKELIELIQNQILRAEAFGIDEHNPHEAVNLSINQAKTILQYLQQKEGTSIDRVLEFTNSFNETLNDLRKEVEKTRNKFPILDS